MAGWIKARVILKKTKLLLLLLLVKPYFQSSQELKPQFQSLVSQERSCKSTWEASFELRPPELNPKRPRSLVPVPHLQDGNNGDSFLSQSSNKE